MYFSTASLLKKMHEIAWQHGMPKMSHFLQLQVLLDSSIIKLTSPFLTLNLVSKAQQANHLLLPILSLCNLLHTLGHNLDSTFKILSQFCWDLFIIHVTFIEILMTIKIIITTRGPTLIKIIKVALTIVISIISRFPLR